MAPYRGNEKGRVERAIRYARTSFFPAREFTDLADLNRQAMEWTIGLAADRTWPEGRSRKVRDAFSEERERLLALPADRFPTAEILQLPVGKTPYVRFNLNDYSVPHAYVRRTVTAVADDNFVRIVEGNETIAVHPRTFDRGRQIEDPAHIDGLVQQKAKARAHRTLDALHEALPSFEAFIAQVANRGGSLGGTTSAVEKLHRRYGAHALNKALTEALARSAPHLGAVRQILDQQRRDAGKPPPVEPAIANDPRLQHIVTPHSLDDYDQLSTEETDNHDNTR